MAESLSESPPQQGPICPVCFRDYSDSETNLIPRILQCGHTYCTECLERLLNMEPEEDEDQTMVFNIHYAGRRWMTTRRFPSIFNPPRPPRNEIKCPTCKMENRIDNRDITTLTKNFALLGLRTQASVSIHSKRSHYCKDHDHEKRIYCRDCKTLICAYCQLYGEHKDHVCKIAIEAAKPTVELLKEAKEKLVCDFDALTQGESVVNSAIVKLERNRERCERKVRRYFDRFIGRLNRRRDDLLLDIGSWTEDQMCILDAQIKSLSNAIKDSESIQANCQSLIEGDPLEALTQEEDILKEVDEIQSRAAGLSFQPLINPWIKCKVTRSEYDDSIDEILESCQLKFNTDISQEKVAVVDFSEEDEESESESESSMLDHYDEDVGDDNHGGDRDIKQSHMSFQDQANSSVTHSGARNSSSAIGGASLNHGHDRDNSGGGDDDVDLFKKREQMKAGLVHSQETRMGGGAASLMPKLELADSTALQHRWGYHPSSSSLGVRHSLPTLSGSSASSGGATGVGGARNSLRPFGSTPSNTPLHGDTDPMSPTQASKGSASFLFNLNLNYNRQRSLSDQLQRVMETLNQTTEELSDEDDDDNNGLNSPPGESRHRLHLIENLSPPFDLMDTYGHLNALGARNHNNSLSSNSHDASFHADDSDDDSPSPHGYPGPSFVSQSVLDSVEALRRSRLLTGGRVGEQSPIDSDEELHTCTTTAGQNYLESVVNTTAHMSSPNLQPGSTSNTPSRSPLQTTEQEDTDFAFGHHLSLPVDSNGQETEIVFPRHYSWTSDHGEPFNGGGGGAGGGAEGGNGGRGIRLQLEQNGTTIQVSMDLHNILPDDGLSNSLNVSNEIEGDGGEMEDREGEERAG